MERLSSDLEAQVGIKLGNAMQSKRAVARRGAWISCVLLILGILLIAGIMLDPKPYYWLMALQTGAPWLAFLLLWRRSVSFGSGWVDKYGAWVLAVLLISLPARIAYYYVSLVRGAPMALLACVLGVLLCAAATLLDPELRAKRHWPILPFLFFTATLYAYAAAFQTNCALDHSPATIHHSVVHAKLLVSGLSYHPDDELRLAPWGTEQDATTSGVPPGLFANVHVGDTVCVVQREGWLRMPWFTVQTCPWTESEVRFGDVGGLHALWLARNRK